MGMQQPQPSRLLLGYLAMKSLLVLPRYLVLMRRERFARLRLEGYISLQLAFQWLIGGKRTRLLHLADVVSICGVDGASYFR